MCGIVGSCGKLNIESFKNALYSIAHRGPDNENYFIYDVKDNKKVLENELSDCENYIALGHRRLSIIDLSEDANQPMYFKNYSVIFNGEIYNYKEIRNELEKNGYQFDTKSDTEVLLKSYDYWGQDCVNKFNGMWAFCIFDGVKNELFLSRDRIGVKPLYYYHDEESFYFASEIKALLEFGIKRTANKKELIKYLIYGNQEHLKETMFDGVFRFPSGSIGIYDLATNELKLENFFDLEKIQIKNEKNEDKIVTSIKSKVDNSVNLRMRSDVIIGMALSGGVDSNIVVSQVTKMDNSIETFSSVYTDDDTINETKNIQITLEKLKLKSNFTTVTKDAIINDIEKIVWYQDEPFDTLGILAQNKVYELMHSKNVKVSLDGQGADEIFAGYPTYKAIYLRENLFNIFKYKEFYKCGFLTIQNFKLVILSFFPLMFEKFYFRKRANKIFDNISFIPSDKKGFVFFKDLNKKLIYDTKEYLSVLLRFVDRNSMQYSVESRGVFLDYKVIENALVIPSKLKIKNCYTKYILRKAFSLDVDERILWDKNKLGFPVPQSKWLQDNEVVKYFDDFITHSNLLKSLNVTKIPKEDSALYWKVVNIAIWEKVFQIEELQ